MFIGASILAVFLGILGSLLSLWIFYWIVRAAVRHGMEDAWRRRAQRASDEAGWDPARR
jgi:membrane protein DedA with SNARE-associated domain